MSLPIVNKVNTREYSRIRSVGINVKVKLTRMVSPLAAGVAVRSCIDIKKKIKYLSTFTKKVHFITLIP